jgi:hypothetical protein
MSVTSNYYSFSPSRADKGWENFAADIKVLREKYKNCHIPNGEYNPQNERQDIVLNSRQDALYNIGLDYLLCGQVYDFQRLIYDLKEIDLYYGSVLSGGYNEAGDEMIFLEGIRQATNLETDKETKYPSQPTKNGWIEFYSNINNETVDKIVDCIVVEAGWELRGTKSLLMEYLHFTRPVILDLKQTPDSIFLSYYDGSATPESADEILKARAEANASKFKNILPPVL